MNTTAFPSAEFEFHRRRDLIIEALDNYFKQKPPVKTTKGIEINLTNELREIVNTFASKNQDQVLIEYLERMDSPNYIFEVEFCKRPEREYTRNSESVFYLVRSIPKSNTHQKSYMATTDFSVLIGRHNE